MVRITIRHYHSDAFQEVMDRLDAAFDYDERVQCFVDAEQILTEECPTLFLYANENITLVQHRQGKGRYGIPDRLLHDYRQVESSRIREPMNILEIQNCTICYQNGTLGSV